MIQEAYVSFEIAKLLKEKGFNIPLDSKNWLCCMYDENERIYWGCYNKNWYFRVTHQIVIMWMRVVYHIFIEIHASIDHGKYHFCYSILDKECKYIRRGFTDFDWNYEQTIEAALKYTLENLI